MIVGEDEKDAYNLIEDIENSPAKLLSYHNQCIAVSHADSAFSSHECPYKFCILL